MSDPTAAQYGTETAKIETELPSSVSVPSKQPAEQGPALPFTGLDVAAMLIVAAALTVFGAILRRASSAS